MNKEIRYVGIDPSSKTGLVILDFEGNVVQAGEIKSSYKEDPQRMLDIVNRIKKYLNCSTDYVLVEGFSFNSVGKSIDFQFGLGWMIRAMLHLDGFNWVVGAPTSIKKFATGNGRSGKAEVINSVKENWEFEYLNRNGKPNDNVADAYAMARFLFTTKNKEEYEKLNNKQKEAIIKFMKENN